MAENAERLILKPGPDRRVRQPDGTLLAATGEPVNASPYWARRLRDGDVVETTLAKKKD